MRIIVLLLGLLLSTKILAGDSVCIFHGNWVIPGYNATIKVVSVKYKYNERYKDYPKDPVIIWEITNTISCFNKPDLVIYTGNPAADKSGFRLCFRAEDIIDTCIKDLFTDE